MPDALGQADLAVGDALLIGLLGCIALCQLQMFLLTRHRNELWCSVYLGLAVLLLASHSGHAIHYLWPRAPALDPLALAMLPSLMVAAGILLSISFLNLRQRRPGWVPWLYSYCGLLPVLAGVHLSGQLTSESRAGLLDVAMIAIGLGLACQVWLAIDASRRDRSAIAYCAAWAVYLVAVLHSNTDLHAIARSDPVYRVGLSLHSLLLALALAARIVLTSEQRRQRADRSAVQVEVLEQALQYSSASLHAIRLLASQRASAVAAQHLQCIERMVSRLARRLDGSGDQVVLLQGRFTAADIEFELPAMLREVLNDIAPSAQPAPLLYGVVDSRLPLWVRGDRLRLRRLLAELAERSLDVPGTDSVALRLCMGSGPVGQRISLIVSLCAPRAAELWGKRLRCLVAALGGNGGTRCNGTELWLRLPLHAASYPPERLVPARPRTRILLLHPHRTYRCTLASVLGAQGYRVDSVSDGPQALACIEASQRGDRRYDWLLAQPGPGDWNVHHMRSEIHRRWPHSAIRVLELLEWGRPTSAEAVKRPLLCCDVAALLRPAASGMRRCYPSLVPPPSTGVALGPLHGLRVLIAAADRDERNALAIVLEGRGCRVDQCETGRDLTYRYRRYCRGEPARLDALVLCGTAALATDIRALRHFERGRRLAPLLLLVVVDGTVKTEAECVLRRAGASDILRQPVTLEMLTAALTSIDASVPVETPRAVTGARADPAIDPVRQHRRLPG